MVKNWFFRDFSLKYDPRIDFLQFFLHNTMKNFYPLSNPKIKGFYLLPPSGELKYTWNFNFLEFLCNLTPKRNIFWKFVIGLAPMLNTQYSYEKKSWLIMIFVKCHAFYDFKNVEKLQSEICPLSNFFFIFGFFLLFHLWCYENNYFF